ncbi:MAG: hypothetical protein IKZ19_07530, partial [Clostridia bacterium]|nr:hypothetical protein [Clostridia bacterium]
PEDHLRMLKYYLGFWTEYRDVLLNGKLTAPHPEICYSSARAELGDSAVIAAYSENLINVTTPKAVAVNVTGESSLVLKNCGGRSYRVVNCMGDELETGVICENLAEVSVPLCGMVFIG